MVPKKQLFSINPIDIFALVNIGLFFFMCYFVYFDRFVRYRGVPYLGEFFIYAVVVFALILLAWKICRRYHLPGWLLAMAQLGIFMHFAGGLTFFGDKRLYDLIIVGVRYDKYVHLLNAAIAGLFVQRFSWEYTWDRVWFGDLVTVLLVLGLGACVEIIEYLVMLTVTINGVGNYDNNMQDLIANLIGVTCCVLLVRSLERMRAGMVCKASPAQKVSS